VDELPTGGLSSKLFQMGVLRPRARNEQVLHCIWTVYRVLASSLSVITRYSPNTYTFIAYSCSSFQRCCRSRKGCSDCPASRYCWDFSTLRVNFVRVRVCKCACVCTYLYE